jgi:hypothetical protein
MKGGALNNSSGGVGGDQKGGGVHGKQQQWGVGGGSRRQGATSVKIDLCPSAQHWVLVSSARR